MEVKAALPCLEMMSKNTSMMQGDKDTVDLVLVNDGERAMFSVFQRYVHRRYGCEHECIVGVEVGGDLYIFYAPAYSTKSVSPAAPAYSSPWSPLGTNCLEIVLD